MNTISIISNTCSILALCLLCLGLYTSNQTYQKTLFLIGNLTILFSSVLAANTLYACNALLCTFASILAFSKLSNRLRLQMILILTILTLIYLLNNQQINNVHSAVAALSLIAMSIGYGSSNNLALLLGGSGIIFYSIIIFINNPSVLPVVYLILNIIFSLFALRAMLGEKRKLEELAKCSLE